MICSTKRQLIFEIQRIQTVRRRVATESVFCPQCGDLEDFAELSELALTFEVSSAEAVLQLRERSVHMLHPSENSIIVCTTSLLERSPQGDPILMKSLPPAAADQDITI